MKQLVTSKALWLIFALSSITFGLYPFIYFIIDRKFGLLASKSDSLLSDLTWNTGFYGHIVLGGIALLVGWIQFSSKIRIERPKLHRNIGKIYIISVLISGLCGLYIATHATGGIIAQSGFFGLGMVWLSTTIISFLAIKRNDILRHQKYMIYSYAACFAAVTLRIWLPLLSIGFGEFIPAYRVVAWMCWVPNIIVAYFLVRRYVAPVKQKKKSH